MVQSTEFRITCVKEEKLGGIRITPGVWHKKLMMPFPREAKREEE